MTSEPDTTIRSMTDRPDVDTLVETVREARGALIETCWTPDEVAEFDAALSDLAARARRVAELEAALRWIKTQTSNLMILQIARDALEQGDE